MCIICTRDIMKKTEKIPKLETLDWYFEMMMGNKPDDEKAVYRLAVQAYINDVAYNGLPKIRRSRYNRELGVAVSINDLSETYNKMMATKRKPIY